MNGAAVIAQLQQTIADMRTTAARQDTDAAQLKQRVDMLVEQRGTTLGELAQHYLPNFNSTTIAATFAEVRQELLDLLQQQESRQRELSRAIESHEADCGRLNTKLADVTARLNELVKQREQLEAVVSAELQKRPVFVELSQRVAQDEIGLQQNEKRAQELAASAREKLPAYERSTLFMYLHRRNFGAPEYPYNGWTRDLDAWVAGLIDYLPARRSYEFLRRTPEVLSVELARRRQDFNELMKQLESIEAEVAEAQGLAAVRRQGKETGVARDRTVAEITALQQQLSQVIQERQQLASTQSTFYRQALNRLQGFLGETKQTVLAARARQTPEPIDDRLVATVADIESELEQNQRQIRELDSSRREATQRIAGLEGVVNRCRQQNFDANRSYFEPSLPVEELMAEYVSGAITADGLWQALAKCQKFQPLTSSSAAQVAVDVLTSPAASRALVQAMVIAADVLGGAASQGAQRRYGGGSFGGGSSGGGGGGGGSSPRGFTTGDGF